MKKKCRDPECNKNVQQGGVCFTHGARGKKCSHRDCYNVVKKGGVCWTHGAKEMSAKQIRKICSRPDCNSTVYKSGVCWTHGANKKKKCLERECTSLAQSNGVCWKHGAKGKKCTQRECDNFVYKGAFCWSHGTKGKTSDRPGPSLSNDSDKESHADPESSNGVANGIPGSRPSIDDYLLMFCLRQGGVPACVETSASSQA